MSDIGEVDEEVLRASFPNISKRYAHLDITTIYNTLNDAGFEEESAIKALGEKLKNTLTEGQRGRKRKIESDDEDVEEENGSRNETVTLASCTTDKAVITDLKPERERTRTKQNQQISAEKPVPETRATKKGM
ncbi:hypothetical protein NEOLI_001424 [Neolecta irregularis DAH-3]|uniref:Uncharacterized protein n=1 Tax=Neolecta irregularis (strain DAH-3) TaxID=1198029 RepID=A0A1U7LG74_NEOID|nr:hypothetical protein NEOLI_001424 [Neolecta irregularis DAH-3]|eukprot:OLL21655.1 hypothetical protein NEOLI_001424 [Neolecta irregularis DAH-3]